MLTETSCSRLVMGWSGCQHTQSVHLVMQAERQPVFTEAESRGDETILDLTICFGDQSIMPPSLAPVCQQTA